MYDLKPPKLTYVTGQCNNPHVCDSTELVKENQEIWCRKCCWRQNTTRLPHKRSQDPRYIEYRRREREKRRMNLTAPCLCGCGRMVNRIGNQKYATKECKALAQMAQRREKAERRARLGMAV